MNTFNYTNWLYATPIFFMYTGNIEYNNISFTNTIKTIANVTKIQIFMYCYTHWKWFHKIVIKKFVKTNKDPFIAFTFDQLMRGTCIDYENKQQRDESVDQYIKDNNLSKEDAKKIKDSINNLVEEVLKKKSQETNTEK